LNEPFSYTDEGEILEALGNLGMELIEAESEDQLDGLMFFTDPKHARYGVFYVRKRGD